MDLICLCLNWVWWWVLHSFKVEQLACVLWSCQCIVMGSDRICVDQISLYFFYQDTCQHYQKFPRMLHCKAQVVQIVKFLGSSWAVIGWASYMFLNIAKIHQHPRRHSTLCLGKSTKQMNDIEIQWTETYHIYFIICMVLGYVICRLYLIVIQYASEIERCVTYTIIINYKNHWNPKNISCDSI